MQQPSDLEHIILGLLTGEPKPAYFVKKTFEETEMSRFSASPGAIYPAVKRLLKAELLEETETTGRSRLCASTAKGRAALRDWIAAPITSSEVSSRSDVLMAKFVFSPRIGDAGLAVSFLERLLDAQLDYLDSLGDFTKSLQGQERPEQSAAIGFAVATVSAQAEWTRHTLSNWPA